MSFYMHSSWTLRDVITIIYQLSMIVLAFKIICLFRNYSSQNSDDPGTTSTNQAIQQSSPSPQQPPLPSIVNGPNILEPRHPSRNPPTDNLIIQDRIPHNNSDEEMFELEALPSNRGNNYTFPTTNRMKRSFGARRKTSDTGIEDSSGRSNSIFMNWFRRGRSRK